MRAVSRFLSELGVAPAVLVTVHATRGSVPRETGAWMAVFAQTTVATVGGGHLELDAIAHARQLLSKNSVAMKEGQGHPTMLGIDDAEVRYALGPKVGQCCGGEVHLHFEIVSAQDTAALQQCLTVSHMPVALFGGGHVGQALVAVLGTLPMDVTWVDSRNEIFPPHLPDNVQCEHSEPVQAAVAHLRAGSRVLVMSFSHAEDLDVVAACLQRQRTQGDLPYVGLIGSKTKWASFRQRLQARGFTDAELAHITSPIGIPGIADKRPEVIAVAVAAQLLLDPSTPKLP